MEEVQGETSGESKPGVKVKRQKEKVKKEQGRNTKIINGKREKDVTNDMRRVVSGKTDSLNNDSHSKHLDVCCLFLRFTQRNSWLKAPVSLLSFFL